MSKEEDKERGNLTVTLPYINFAQQINSAIYHLEALLHFLKCIRDKLDIAAIEKGMKERERRKRGDRRKINRRQTQP